MKPIKVAIVGAGAMGTEHAKAFADIPGVTIAGVYNRTRAKAEALAAKYGAAVAESIEELHAVTRADLAVVAVYETAINPIVKKVLAFPWAVMMEKPVGLDHADAMDIAAAAVRRNDVFVGLNRRTLSSTRAVLEDLAADDAPRFIHVQDQQSLQVAREIGHAEPVVRNWMYANSIHLVDYLKTFGRGEAVKVERMSAFDPEAPGVVLAKVEFSSGDLGLYEGIWNGPGPWACTVTTVRRRWELRPLEKATFQNAGERKLNPLEPDAWDANFKPGLRRQADNVVRAIRGEEGVAVSLAEAVGTMKLVRDIFSRG